MARFLALDWDHQELHLVSASVGRGGVRIERAAVWQQGQSPNPAEAEELGRVLRDRLKEAGMAPAPVLVSIGRDRVILKDVRYPQVSAAEEAAVVRFQAAKELTYPVEEVVIDYTPTGEPAASGERRAQALILRRELLTTYQVLCRAAGLKLAGITPRPFGIAACVRHAVGPVSGPEGAGAAAVLTVTGHWAEFCVVREGQVLFGRTLATGPGLVGEIRRNLALYAGQPHTVSARDRVQALYVAGNGEHNLLREQLQSLLAIPVHPLDPFVHVERLELTGNRGGFAGAVGLLHVQAEARGLPINFAQPREPRPARDPKQARYVFAAGVGLLLIIVLLIVGRNAVAQRDQVISELQDDIESLDSRLGRLKKDSTRLHELQGWTDRAVSWLDELADLSQRFPVTRVMHLKEVTGAPLAANTPGKKYVAQLAITGVLKGDEREVQQLLDRLAEDSISNRYRIASKTVVPAADDQTPGTFSTRVDIEKKTAPDKDPLQKGGNQALRARGRRQP